MILGGRSWRGRRGEEEGRNRGGGGEQEEWRGRGGGEHWDENRLKSHKSMFQSKCTVRVPKHPTKVMRSRPTPVHSENRLCYGGWMGSGSSWEVFDQCPTARVFPGPRNALLHIDGWFGKEKDPTKNYLSKCQCSTLGFSTLAQEPRLKVACQE